MPLWKVNYHIHKNLPLDPVLRHLGAVNNLTRYCFNIQFNVVLKFKSGLPPTT
jgi:hypothetical protein